MLTKEIRNRIEEELQIDLDRRTARGKHLRRRDHVYARALYYGICREVTNLSLDEIGKTLDQNHATVLHSIKNVFSNLEFWSEKFYVRTYNKVLSEVDPIKQALKDEKAKNKSYLQLLGQNALLQSMLDKANNEVENSGEYREKYIKANVRLQHLKGLILKKQSITAAKNFISELELIKE